MSQLNSNFLHELFKSSLKSKSVLDIIIEHLRFEFLPTDPYKKIFERIKLIYTLEKVTPTIGSLSQHFNNDDAILKCLYEIDRADVIDKQEAIVAQFEEYLKKARFVQLYNKIGLMYNEGKSAQAIAALVKESKSIEEFTLVKTDYDAVFGNFSIRNIQRMKNNLELKSDKIPFNIHELDFYTSGGIERGSSCLFMARSGKGKSTGLRWLGLNAANMGYKVVHFQFEGTKSEALTLYDSAWTALTHYTIEQGLTSQMNTESIDKSLNNIRRGGGEIFVIEANSFGALTIETCRATILDIEKKHGMIDLILFDYLEIIKTAKHYEGNEKAERMRRLYIANTITDIGKSTGAAVVTATQANSVDPSDYNNPNWIMTRNNIADAKNIVNPFSYFLTFNQTDDEYRNGILRIYIDKMRKGQSGQTAHIYQNLKIARFYNAKKTCSVFWDNNENKKITTNAT